MKTKSALFAVPLLLLGFALLTLVPPPAVVYGGAGAGVAAPASPVGAAFVATMSANQTIPSSSSWTLVDFDTSSSGTFTAGTSKWTPGVAGVAQIIGSVELNEVSNAGILVAIYKNGSAVANTRATQVSTGQQSYLVSYIDPACAATDYYQIYIYDTGTALGVFDTYSYFCGVLIL